MGEIISQKEQNLKSFPPTLRNKNILCGGGKDNKETLWSEWESNPPNTSFQVAA